MAVKIFPIDLYYNFNSHKILLHLEDGHHPILN